MLEIRTVLVQMLRRFVLQPVPGSERHEQWRRSGITYVPADDALVYLSALGADHEVELAVPLSGRRPSSRSNS